MQDVKSEKNTSKSKKIMYTIVFIFCIAIVYLACMDLGGAFFIFANDPKTSQIYMLCWIFFGVVIGLGIVSLLLLAKIYGFKDLHFKIYSIIFGSISGVMLIMNLVYMIWILAKR